MEQSRIKKPLYSPEPWLITEDKFTVENNHHNEAIFSIGNGYMGMRGTLEEDYSGPGNTTTPGMYINGVYTSEKIIYGEEAPKLPLKGQTILNIADWSTINIYLDNEKYDMLEGEVSNYSRVLDMKEGLLKRSLIWTSPTGKEVSLKIVRFLSQSSPHLGLIVYKFKPLNFSGSLAVITEIDGDSKNYHYPRKKKVLTIKDKGFKDEMGYIIQEDKGTSIQIAISTKNVFEEDSLKAIKKQSNTSFKDKIVSQYDLEVVEGEEYCLNRYLAVYISLDLEPEVKPVTTKFFEYVFNELHIAAKKGSSLLFQEHFDFMKKYWDDVDVKIDGDLALQQAFRFNAFQLLQSTGRDGKTNIAAKGLTGEFYEGHYFWDTETYIIPFYLYSKPNIAKKLLLYRFHNLDKARENAKRMNVDGALFPWRTINGEEASGFFMGSTVQYHINADIAYAIYQYVSATDDKEFLYKYGTEILVETARMWADRGDYIPLKDNKFCLNEVCGPDEYKPGVNNNCYTNYMAKFNLQFALKTVKKLKVEEPGLYSKLRDKVKLEDKELLKWERAANNMYLPFNEDLGIHPQDDSFLFKKPIDISSISPDELPLVRNWHPLVIWRYQLIKQADILLLMLLLGNHFTIEEKKANYYFYEPKTTHDSSLSPAIHSIIANEIGYFEDGYRYFMMTARLDLDDYNKNTYQGLHTACMAGSWLALIQGFAGMRNYDGKLYFAPKLPPKWQKLEFKLKFRGSQIKIVIKPGISEYELIKGKEIVIYHEEKEIYLKRNEKYKINNKIF